MCSAGPYNHPEELLRAIRAEVASHAGKANSPNLATIDRVLTAEQKLTHKKIWTP